MSRSNVERINEFIRHVRYKPGWKMEVGESRYAIFAQPCTLDIYVRVIYPAYDQNIDPLYVEALDVERVRKRIVESLGCFPPTVQTFSFIRSFDDYDIDGMNDKAIMEFVIAGTIKQAEMQEFERWLKWE